MKTYNITLFLVSGVTLAATIFALREGLMPNSSVFWKSGEVKASESIRVNSLDLESRAAVFSDLSKPVFYDPVEIIMPGKSIKIENVGLTEDATLDVPKNWINAGWYVNSAKAGEAGNLIIDGHYDDNKGLPAAFWGLKTLKVNDTVRIRDAFDAVFVYKVRSVWYVDIQDPGRTLIFEKTDLPELTLVTCGGVWDSNAHTYSKRLVVKADLVQ
jgi:sortase (surface protein transpeptidase)